MKPDGHVAGRAITQNGGQVRHVSGVPNLKRVLPIGFQGKFEIAFRASGHARLRCGAAIPAGGDLNLGIFQKLPGLGVDHDSFDAMVAGREYLLALSDIQRRQREAADCECEANKGFRARGGHHGGLLSG